MGKKVKKTDKTFDEMIADFEKSYNEVVSLRADAQAKQDEYNEAKKKADNEDKNYKVSIYDFLLNQLDLKGVNYSIKDIIKACVYVHHHFPDAVPDEAFVEPLEVIQHEASAASAVGEE